MTDFNGILDDTFLTRESILKDFDDLQEYYRDMSLSSEVFELEQGLPIPMLVAALEDDEKDRPRAVTNSFMLFDRENAQFTKYLQYYTELSNDITGIEREDLLAAINTLNSKLPVGSCFLVEERPELSLPLKAGVRLIQGFPLNQPIDQGVFTENLFLFDFSCSLVSDVMDLLAEGKTLQEAYAVLGE